MVEGDSLQRLDGPCRYSALAFYPAQLDACFAEVYLPVGYWRERVGPGEGYTLINEHQAECARC